MNILVTGANGYLGGGLVPTLEAQNHRVNKLDGHGRVWGVMQFPPEQTQVVVHLAWYSRVGNGEKEIQEACYLRTRSLIQSAARYRPYFILASSAAVYGDGKGPCKETTRVNPNCHYSHYKALAEVELGKAMRVAGFPAMGFRFGSLMGRGVTRTKQELVVNAFALDGYRKKRVEVWNPDCYKPVLHVEDAVSLIALAIRHQWKGTVNAAYGSFRAGEIAECVGKLTGAEVKEVETPSIAPAKSCILDCTRLSRLLSKSAPFGPFKTVDATVKEFEDYKDSPDDVTRPWKE